MADPVSVQLLSFKFAPRTFAYLRLAQLLSGSMSAFSSFMRKYMDPCIAADQYWWWYDDRYDDVDDLGTAAHNFEKLFFNLSKIFTCINWVSVKLTMSKSEFGSAEISFLGSIISSERKAPKKSTTLLEQENPKNMRRLIGFFQLFTAFIHQLSEKLLPFLSPIGKPRENYWHSSWSIWKIGHWFNTGFWNIIATLKNSFTVCSNGRRQFFFSRIRFTDSRLYKGPMW